MFVRWLIVLAAASTISSELLAQDDVKLPYDRSFTLRLSGEAATAYITAEDIHKPGEGSQIETSARIAQVLKDGRVRIEHSSPIKQPGKPERLLTLSAIVAPTQFATRTTPKGTKIYASPAAFKSGEQPTTTIEDREGFILELSEMKAVKIRVWAIVTEVGH